MNKTVLTILGIAATLPALADDVAVLTAPAGRFAFGQVGMVRADQFLLDTQTGKMWHMAYSEGSPVLEPVAFFDAFGHPAGLEPEPSWIAPLSNPAAPLQKNKAK